MPVRFGPPRAVDYFQCDACGWSTFDPLLLGRCNDLCCRVICDRCTLCNDCDTVVKDVMLFLCAKAVSGASSPTRTVSSISTSAHTLESCSLSASSNESDDISFLTMRTTEENRLAFASSAVPVDRVRFVNFKVRASSKGGVTTRLKPRKAATIASSHTMRRYHYDAREPIRIQVRLRACRNQAIAKLKLRLVRGTTRY